jgi:transketolase
VTLAAAKHVGPIYFRLGRSETPIVTTPESPFEIGKAELMYTKNEAHQKSVGIVTTGSLLYNALQAAVVLEREGVGVSVLHMATIKPLDTDALQALADTHSALVTVEEHQVMGGLGSAVAEYLAENKPTRLVRVGIHDVFGQSGNPDELIAHYGMDVPAIIAAAKKLV